MRNLKKIVAVIMAVAMIASMMVPALAASVANEEQAKALKSIGLFKGVSDTDLGLASALPRIQAMTLIIRAEGQDAAALALTQAEIDEQLAKVADGATIAGWAKPYAAYALKTGITNGVGRNGKVYFDANADTKGSLYVTLVLRAMGYADVDYTNPWDTATTAKLSSSIGLGLKTSLIRDEAVGLLYTAVKSGVCKDGKSLIQTLVDAKAVKEADAIAAGFPVTATPTALDVVSASGTNLKEIVVKFNMALNKDNVKVANFTVEGANAAAVALSADNKEVTVTVATVKPNGSDYKLVVKKEVGLAANVEKTVRIIDNTLPTVTDVKVTGPKTLEVIFSEPVTGSGNVLVNNGVYGAGAAAPDGNKVVVTLGAALADGNYTIKVTGYKDFAGYSMDSTEKTVAYAKDTSPLTAKITSAKQNEVVIEFSKTLNMTPNANHFYHTFSAWKPANVTGSGAKWTLDFSNYYIPEGNFNLTIKATDGTTKIADAWGVELGSDLVVSSSVTADKTAPTVALNKVNAEDKITIDYSETVVGALTASNYAVKNAADGTTVKDVTITPTLNKDNSYFITFSKKLDGGNYVLVISNIKDNALSPNAMGATSINFTVTDLTAATVKKIEAVQPSDSAANELVYVTFSEAMGTSVTDVNNYRLIASDSTMVTPKNISLFSGNKYKVEFAPNTTLAGATLVIGQIPDVAGNKPSYLTTSDAVVAAAQPVVTSVKTLTKNTIQIVVDSVIPSVAASDIYVTKTGVATPDAVAMVSYTNDGSKTTIVATLTAGTAMTKTDEVPQLVNITAGGLKADTGVSNSVNITTSAACIADGIAPEFNAYVTGSGILNIDFTEALGTTVAQFAINDLNIKVGDKVLTPGIDFTTAVTSTTAIQVTFATAPAAGKIVTVSSKDTVTYIKDLAGNAAKAFNTSKELKY